jgi:hypothetical protein
LNFHAVEVLLNAPISLDEGSECLNVTVVPSGSPYLPSEVWIYQDESEQVANDTLVFCPGGSQSKTFFIKAGSAVGPLNLSLELSGATFACLIGPSVIVPIRGMGFCLTCVQRCGAVNTSV